VPLVKTGFDNHAGQFSPDGRWLAYDSNESGNRFDVYVQSFPGPGEKIILSAAGGAQPRWRHDGKELFYIGLDGRLMAVPLSVSADGSSLRPGAAVPLFVVHVPGGPLQRGANRQQYAVSRDGQRFYVLSLIGEPTNPISVILNWKPPS
jgi:WD40 repeat protein